MKTYLYPLLAGLLSLAACTNDTLQEIAPVAPGENNPAANTGKGTFFVDYSVDGGASTRAGNPLKVQTLDYYVYYAEGGELVKHRRIRINSNQSFPLTRENMTWEQRQALQDTLQYDVKYRTLFIANVDSTLFNYDTYGDTNPHPAVVTGDTLYQNARILLPNVPFHEDNYYCLWEDTLHQLSTKPLDGPMKRNDVLLQRIVTRTDIRRVDTPTTIEAIAEHLYNQCNPSVEIQISNQIDAFCSTLDKESGTSIDVGNSNMLRPYGPYGDHDYVEDLKNYLKKNISIIQKDIKTKIVNEYKEAIKEKYNIRTEWSVANYVRCNYKESTRIQAIGFDLAPYIGENTTPNIPFNASQLSIVGFAGRDGSNVINSIDFYSSASPDSPIFTINEEPLIYTSIGIQEKNRLYNVTCDPVCKIEMTQADIKKIWIIKMNDLFSGIGEWDTYYTLDLREHSWSYGDSFMGAIKRRVFDDYEGFGTDIDNFEFPITQPVIQSDADFRFIPSWNMTIAE